MATPSPSPPVEGADGTLALAGAEFVLGAGLFMTTAAVVSIVLYRTARMRPESMIAVSVSILTLVAIFGATAVQTEEISTALVGLAGVGLGALAGALTGLFNAPETGGRRGKPDETGPGAALHPPVDHHRPHPDRDSLRDSGSGDGPSRETDQ